MEQENFLDGKKSRENALVNSNSSSSSIPASTLVFTTKDLVIEIFQNLLNEGDIESVKTLLLLNKFIRTLIGNYFVSRVGPHNFFPDGTQLLVSDEQTTLTIEQAISLWLRTPSMHSYWLVTEQRFLSPEELGYLRQVLVFTARGEKDALQNYLSKLSQQLASKKEHQSNRPMTVSSLLHAHKASSGWPLLLTLADSVPELLPSVMEVYWLHVDSRVSSLIEEHLLITIAKNLLVYSPLIENLGRVLYMWLSNVTTTERKELASSLIENRLTVLIHFSGRSAFFEAVCADNLEVVEFLLANGLKPESSWLDDGLGLSASEIADRAGFEQLFQFLLEQNLVRVNIPIQGPASKAQDLMRQGDVRRLKLVCQSVKKIGVEISLTSPEKWITAQQWLDYQLCYACYWFYSPSIVKVLLDAGASPNAVDNTIKQGVVITPLISIVNDKKLKLLDLLLATKRINFENADASIVALACEKDYWEIATRLIQAEAPVDRIDDKGKTALFYATSKEQTSIIKLLLKYGADPEKAMKDVDSARCARWGILLGRISWGPSLLEKKKQLINMIDAQLENSLLAKFSNIFSATLTIEQRAILQLIRDGLAKGGTSEVSIIHASADFFIEKLKAMGEKRKAILEAYKELVISFQKMSNSNELTSSTHKSFT